MKKQFLKVFAAVATVLFVSQPAVAAECDTREALFRAAAEAGVKLNQEQTVTSSAPGVSFAGTSIAGFENVPATRLPEGADAGFIYLDAPESGIPTGFYRLNARAEAPRLGSYDGSVGLISADGKEVARLPATMETWSMEVPRELPYAQTRMSAQLDNNPMGEQPQRIIIIIRCPNGTTIIISIDW